MKVTVCELSNEPQAFAKEWDQLVTHCQENRSELLLLPEMPFFPWIAHHPIANPVLKMAAEKAHEAWLPRIEELGDCMVAYSRPQVQGDQCFNTAYVWTREGGHQKVHSKYYFPEEEGFYEETWFDRESLNFELIEVRGIKIGFLLCTEIWFTQYTRAYGLAGMDILFCPRATGRSSTDQWLRCGQTSSVIGGCYCLSSNRSGVGKHNFDWGGSGWITQPMDGALLGVTSKHERFLTVEVDILQARQAKMEYPLYVRS